MSIKDGLRSKLFKRSLLVLGIIILALVIFQAGLFVGYRKAAFAYGWGDNYYRVFGERKNKGDKDRGFPGFMMGGRMGDRRGFLGGDFSNSHGVIGSIVKIDLPTLVIAGSDKVEKIIVLKDSSVINRWRETIKAADLKVGDVIMVVGSPNAQSQIEAGLVRVMPMMPVQLMPVKP